jgi:hypothetical protein
MTSGAYWEEYSDESESSRERHRDPKHSRRTTEWAREKSRVRSVSEHPSDNEEDFVQETPEATLVAAQAYRADPRNAKQASLQATKKVRHEESMQGIS